MKKCNFTRARYSRAKNRCFKHLLEFHAERVPLPETHHAVCTSGGQVPRCPFDSRTKLQRTESQRWLVTDEE